jgi:peptide/nickel transport system substrate-binding protein
VLARASLYVVERGVTAVRNNGARRSRVGVLWALALCIGVSLVLAQPSAQGSRSQERVGGVVRVVYRGSDIDSLDPALAYSVASSILLDTTCARLLGYGKSGLEPEVAAGLPRISRDRKTYTFTLRSGLRFSDGRSVDASAFATAITRTLAPGVKSPWAAYTSEIGGAERVRAGKAATPSGVVASGKTLVVRLKRPVPDFPAQTTFLCAVPPALPPDPEGVAEIPAAGPYYISEYRPGDRLVIRRNPYYGGKRRHYVDGFSVDLRASSHEEVLNRIERGDADWGWALAPAYFSPTRRLAAKYGVNKSRFFVRPGATFRGYAFNTARPLFRDNPRLRRAVSHAIDRAGLRRAGGGKLSSRLTDQYLPPGMAGFKDERIYPLDGPDLRRAWELARGHTRGGKLLLYTIDFPNHIAFAQSIKQNLAKIGLDVRIKGIPLNAYFGGLMARGPYDLGFATWTPDYADPYAVLNVQLDSRFIGTTNWPRFDSAEYNRLLRRAARQQGRHRYRVYGQLDAEMARDVAPMVAVDYLTDPTLVSKRIGCVRGSFDLTAVCLR